MRDLSTFEKAKYGTSTIVGAVTAKVSYDVIRDHQKKNLEVLYVKDLDKDVDDLFDDDEFEDVE